MARADAIHIDGPVVLFALGVMLASGIFAGVISSRSSRDEHVLATLQEASRTHSGGQGKAKLRQALLAFEMALTVVLLIGAGLLLKGYRALRTVNVGCPTENVLTMHLSLPEIRYQQPEQKLAFLERLITQVRQLPGVQKAGLVTQAPGTGYGGDNVITIAEHPPLPKRGVAGRHAALRRSRVLRGDGHSAVAWKNVSRRGTIGINGGDHQRFDGEEIFSW